MALRLRSNGAPLSGALFVSNPRKRKKPSRKARRKTTRRVAAKRRAAPKRRVSRRRNTAAAKARRAAALKALRNRRNKSATKRRNRSAAAKRRNAAAAKRRRNVSGKRRNAVSKRRRNVSAKRRNPVRKRRNAVAKRRRNPVAKRRNPIRRTRRNANPMSSFGNRLAAPIQRIVGKVPVIGSLAKRFVAPLVMGAAAGAVHYYGVKALQRYAPAVAERIQPVQFTVAGSLAAAILLAGGKIPLLKKVSAKTRNQIAAAALILGSGLDTYRFLSNRMGDLGDLGDDVALFDYSGIGMDLGESVPMFDYSGIGMDLGDGGAYDVVPFAGLAMDGSPVDYSTAEFSDFTAAPADLSVAEGEAALGGLGAWAGTFGALSVVRTKRGGGLSEHAGQPGHRFGWLIKLVGFDRFQQIASLPPQQRVALIGQMKQQAAALADQQRVEADASSLGGLGLDLGATMIAGSVL